MNRSILSRFVLPLALTVACLGQATAAAAAGSVPFVDSKAIKEHFTSITAQDMDLLRTKKILFASRSFGLNLCNGLRRVAKADAKYEILSTYQRFDVFKAGGDFSIIPVDAFEKLTFVHFMATYWPHTKRVQEMDDLLRNPPHNFAKTVDAVIIFYHTAVPEAFDVYSPKMDALRADFPNIRFIYVTAGFSGPQFAANNEKSQAFSEKIRAKYKGVVPLYDLGAILSDDFRGGPVLPPEYFKDPTGLHPDLPAAEDMMAKGFLLVLRDTFRQKGVAAKSSEKIQPGKAGDAGVEAPLPATHPEAKAVRALLDANGLTEKKVEGLSVVRKGHIVALFLQEGGISEVTKDIGVLTQLEVLHLYADRDLPLARLKTISPAIGKCTKLQELLLNNNDLTSLPVEITQLKKLTSLSVANNSLTALPPGIAAWVKRYDAKGLELQRDK